MLMLLEGTDGVGKSTLAQRITEWLREHRPNDSVELWHRGVPSQHPVDEYVVPLLGYRPGRGHHIICDRWHWGELVYPRVKNRESLMDDAQFWYAEQFLRSRGALGVHLWRDVVELQDVFRERSEFVLTETELMTTRNLFTHVRGAALISSVEVRPDESDVVEFLVAEAVRAENQARILNDFVTYIGPPEVDALLVGDVRGLSSRHPLGTAFMPYPSTSGAYLSRALLARLHHLDGARLGIVNGCDVDALAKVMSVVQPISVVALGNNAHRACAGLLGSYPNGAVPHPQYVRRFHHPHHAAYGDAIVEALQTGKDMRTWRP